MKIKVTREQNQGEGGLDNLQTIYRKVTICRSKQHQFRTVTANYQTTEYLKRPS
jgi:hypothetical protein